jgi:hypothetical protein
MGYNCSMALNGIQFFFTPDPSVVTARRKPLTRRSQSNNLKKTPDKELWEMRIPYSHNDDVEQELKSRNLL